MTTIKNQKLSFGTKLSYGVGEIGQQCIQLTLSYFLLFYLTTYAGISPVAAGTMILVARIWDAANDPIMGIIVDNTNSKWGKARPYLLFCSIPMAIFFVLCFAVPDLSPGMKLTFLYIVYIGQGMFYTATGIPYKTLIPRMTDDPLERISLMSFSGISAYLPYLFVPAIAGMITNKFATEADMGRGYTATAIVFGVVLVICYFITFFNVREKVAHQEVNKLSVKEGLKAVAKNIHWVKIFICNLIYWTLSGILSGTAVFYIDYFLKRPDLRGVLLPVALIPMIISMLLVKKTVAKYGKRSTLLFGILIALIGYLMRLITKDSSVTAYVISNLIIGFGIGFYAVLVLPLAADTIEYGEWKYGIRTESLSISGITFTNKLGLGLAAAIIGSLLERSGYVAKAQVQSEAVLEALFNISVIIPLIGIVIPGLILYTYKLDNQMPKIMEELAVRRGQNKSVKG